jgi:hypothetical protein
VEMQTGLPIGHHAVACDHAVAHGMAAWDLADAALDFHDRNCVICTHRLPVALPILSTLLRGREVRRRKVDAERQALCKERLEARAQRQQIRQLLRAQLPPPSASLVECLEDTAKEGRSMAPPRPVHTRHFIRLNSEQT